MEAIILAAGLGTRLRPLTDRIPKALVEVAGVPILERVARRLVAAGARRLVINTHHLGEQIERYVARRGGWGVDVRISRELGAAPLETGGGIRQAARLLDLDAPFLVHNADVVTDLDLRALYDSHDPAALATLAVGAHETRSPLLVDDGGVVGVRYPSGTEARARDAVGPERVVSFCGVSVIEPGLPDLMTGEGAFSIIPVYLRLVSAGRRIDVWDVGAALWMDIGTPESLEAAGRAVRERERAR